MTPSARLRAEPYEQGEQMPKANPTLTFDHNEAQGTNGNAGGRSTDEARREWRRYFVVHNGNLAPRRRLLAT